MPELPEVEHLRRGLIGPLVGRQVTDATLHRRDVLRNPGGARHGAARKQDLLSGETITTLTRHGKQLLIEGDRRVLLVHLGMTGSLIHRAQGAQLDRRDHVHATWRLDDGSRLVFRDPRRFGGLWAFTSLAAVTEGPWAALGPDALTIRTSVLHAKLQRSTRAVKAALLDQGVLAGVGNIYADEALFAAGLHPLRPARSLERQETRSLAEQIRRVLRSAIAHGGSTIRDYQDSDGRIGRYQQTHAVYGRAGQPCPRCCAPLQSTRVAQRQTVFCPHCQNEKGEESHRGLMSGRVLNQKKEEKAQSSS